MKITLSSLGIMVFCSIWLCFMPYVFSSVLGVEMKDALDISMSILKTFATVSVAVWAIIKWQTEKNKETLLKRIDQVYIPLRELFVDINSKCNIYEKIIKNNNLEDSFKALYINLNGNEGEKLKLENYARLYNKIIELPSHYMSIRMLDMTVRFCNLYIEYNQSFCKYQEDCNDPFQAIMRLGTELGKNSAYVRTAEAEKELSKLFLEIENTCSDELDEYQKKLELT